MSKAHHPRAPPHSIQCCCSASTPSPPVPIPKPSQEYNAAEWRARVVGLGEEFHHAEVLCVTACTKLPPCQHFSIDAGLNTNLNWSLYRIRSDHHREVCAKCKAIKMYGHPVSPDLCFCSQKTATEKAYSQGKHSSLQTFNILFGHTRRTLITGITKPAITLPNFEFPNSTTNANHMKQAEIFFLLIMKPITCHIICGYMDNISSTRTWNYSYY